MEYKLSQSNLTLLQTLSTTLQSEMPLKSLMTETLNLIADAEFEVFIGAQRSQRTPTRNNYRHGYRRRRFDTTCGTLWLNIPHPRKGSFRPSFLNRYQRYESALQQTIISAYINGVSTAKMDHLVKSMGVEGISKGQVSKLTASLNKLVRDFQTCPLEGHYYPVIYVDAVFEKIRIKGKVTMSAIMVVVGMTSDCRRELIMIDVMQDESKECYLKLLRDLKQRGLRSPRLLVSDGASGLLMAMEEEYPETRWQRCKVHFIRRILKTVKKEDRQTMGKELKAIWYTSNKDESREVANQIYQKYLRKYPLAMNRLYSGLEDTLTYVDFPEFSPRKISSTNILERLNKDLRRRSHQLGFFPSIDSCLRLFIAYAINYSRCWNDPRAVGRLQRRYLEHL